MLRDVASALILIVAGRNANKRKMVLSIVHRNPRGSEVFAYLALMVIACLVINVYDIWSMVLSCKES
jgi:molybdopterin/thiamine biosynthesis adenylyltransferase